MKPGQTLADRYRLVSSLGAGGMGSVFLARDTVLERDVAIKSLLPALARDEALVQRFQREARALARLRHRNIISVHDQLRLDEDTFVLVLEYVPGGSLEDRISPPGLDWDVCADVGAQVCDALTAAHAEGIIHRDIKPSNVLLEPDGTVKVADFGIARMASDGSSKTSQLIGTPSFMAPEQARSQPASPSSDIYSLGVVLFQAATAQVPFASDEGPFAAALMHVVQPVPDPGERRADLPDAAREIIMRALAKEPSERFGSAEEMADALRASAGIASPAPRRASAPPGARPGATRLVTGPTPSGPGAASAPPTVTDAERTVTGATPVRGSRGWMRRTGTLAAVAAAVAGGLVGLGVVLAVGGDDPAPGEGTRIRAGDGSIEIPEGWSSQATGAIPGIPFDAPATARPRDAAGRVVAGRTDGTGPTLLPAAYREGLDEPLPEPAVVRLGNLEALRYDDLPSASGEAATRLYLVPTTRGVQTVACAPADIDPAAFLSDCDALAATLTLSGASAYPIGPDERYAGRLGATLETLEAARTRQRRALAGADTPEGQARAARALATAYARAASALAPIDLGPQGDALNESLVVALRRTGDAYASLADAASEQDAAAYEAATGRVDATEAAVARALEALGAGGYEVG